MLTVYNPKGGHIGTLSSCGRAGECGTHSCFFRRRDVEGVSPWAAAYWGDSPEAIAMRELRDRVVAESGPTTFPLVTVSMGTNCLYVTCQSWTPNA